MFYPEAEIVKNYDAWNNIPIVDGHPQVGGRHVSARSPQVIEQFCLGRIYNATIRNSKLVAEGWFDVEATRRISPSVLDKLEAGEPIELSTGLFTDNYPAPAGAVHNGRPYTHIARNYRPDHLAILVHSTGACSLYDGCGVLATNSCNCPSCNEKDAAMALTKAQRETLIGELTTNSDIFGAEDKALMEGVSDKLLLKMKKGHLLITANCGPDTQMGGMGMKTSGSAAPEEEEEKEAVPGKPPIGNKAMTPEQQKAAFITNMKNLTPAEWFDAAPGEIQESLREAQSIRNEKKANIVRQLVANIAEDKREEKAKSLMARSLPELSEMLELVGNSAQPRSSNNPFAEGSHSPGYNYTGAAGYAPTVNGIEGKDREDVLPLLTMNDIDAMDAA